MRKKRKIPRTSFCENVEVPCLSVCSKMSIERSLSSRRVFSQTSETKKHTIYLVTDPTKDEPETVIALCTFECNHEDVFQSSFPYSSHQELSDMLLQ